MLTLLKLRVQFLEKQTQTIGKEELWHRICTMAEGLGFAHWGCTPVRTLAGSREECRYFEAREMGHFGKMEYLKKNVEKRMDPALLLPGARSIIVFLAPFASKEGACTAPQGLKYSEFALGKDYHQVIKDRLYRIAELIEEACMEKKSCRVFTDSAPVMERAWAVRAGLGFIGKNNFLISPKAGIKNFIGVIITKSELPYSDKEVENGCGQCTRCLDACSRKALYAPYKVDASKCLSYKTIEEHDEGADNGRTEKGAEKWVFGCDDCMNACPWNRFNKPGWEEFSSNRDLLKRCSREFWANLTEEEFRRIFKDSPLFRAGLEKMKNNVSR